jgi:hypothetical protein
MLMIMLSYASKRNNNDRQHTFKLNTPHFHFWYKYKTSCKMEYANIKVKNVIYTLIYAKLFKYHGNMVLVKNMISKIKSKVLRKRNFKLFCKYH